MAGIAISLLVASSAQYHQSSKSSNHSFMPEASSDAFPLSALDYPRRVYSVFSPKARHLNSRSFLHSQHHHRMTVGKQTLFSLFRNMLATSQSTTHQRAPYGFLPAIPSPLSPRSANIHGGRRAAYTMSSSSESESLAEKKNASGNVAKDAQQPFSQRAGKKAPSPKPDELRERRRSLFLRRVRDGREEKRFEARGEDVCRDFLFVSPSFLRFA